MALQEFDVGGSGFGGVPGRECQHFVGHVEAERAPRRSDTLRRKQDVDPAARTEVEHALTLAQLGDRGRVATAEGGHDRGARQLVALEGGVEGSPDRLGLTATGRTLGRPDRNLGVVGAHVFVDLFGHGYRSFGGVSPGAAWARTLREHIDTCQYRGMSIQ